MAGNDEQAAWLRRVLGVTLPSVGATDGPPVLQIWREAKEQVDAGISELQGRMRRHPLPALARIADAGLNGITDKQAVGMMAAMMEADRAANPVPARRAMAAFRGFIASDVAAAIDDNPFGVKVGLRGTFGAALDAIERRLGA